MKTKPTITLLALLLASAALIVGCSSFKNGAPPTKFEQQFFDVKTNQVQVVTPAPGNPGSFRTNLAPTYTYTPGPGVDTVKTIGNLVPGYGNLIGLGIGALTTFWAWLRSAKNRDTGITLAQNIETIREFVKALPNGATYDTVLTTWLQQHQAEAGTIQQVLEILDKEVSNPDAQIAAEQILASIRALNPSAAVPPSK